MMTIPLRTINRVLLGSLLSALLLAAPTVWAETQPDSPADESDAPERSSEKGRPIGFDAAIKVGGTFHTMFNNLKPFLILEIEGGVLLLDRRLGLDLGVAWAQPPARSDGEDPRFDGESYSWKLRQDFLTFSILARYRFLPREKRVNVFAGLGPRLYLLRSVATGSADGEAFGETRQYETRMGAVLVAGPEITLGPGAIGAELAFAIGNLDGMLTGDTTATALDLLVSYRLMF